MKCSKCGRDNLTEDDFYRRSRRGRDPFKQPPLMSHCKECHKRWVEENLAVRRAMGILPDEASLERRRAHAREYQRRRYYADLEQSRAKARERYLRSKIEKKNVQG